MGHCFCHDLGAVAEGEAGADGAGGHEDEGDAIDFLAAELVAQVAEEELAAQSTDEGNADDHVVDAVGELPGLAGGGVVVVEAAEELGDGGDAEEVVCVGEESHSGDDDRREMVPLRFGNVKCVQHFQLFLGHNLPATNTQIVNNSTN